MSQAQAPFKILLRVRLLSAHSACRPQVHAVVSALSPLLSLEPLAAGAKSEEGFIYWRARTRELRRTGARRAIWAHERGNLLRTLSR